MENDQLIFFQFKPLFIFYVIIAWCRPYFANARTPLQEYSYNNDSKRPEHPGTSAFSTKQIDHNTVKRPWLTSKKYKKFCCRLIGYP